MVTTEKKVYAGIFAAVVVAASVFTINSLFRSKTNENKPVDDTLVNESTEPNINCNDGSVDCISFVESEQTGLKELNDELMTRFINEQKKEPRFLFVGNWEEESQFSEAITVAEREYGFENVSYALSVTDGQYEDNSINVNGVTIPVIPGIYYMYQNSVMDAYVFTKETTTEDVLQFFSNLYQ